MKISSEVVDAGIIVALMMLLFFFCMGVGAIACALGSAVGCQLGFSGALMLGMMLFAGFTMAAIGQ